MMIVLPLLTVSCATMAPVRGQVILSQDAGSRWSDSALVYLESRDPERECPMLEPVTLVLAAEQFQPSIAVCGSGSILRIRNQDRVYHTPFSRSPEAPFEGEPLHPGQTRNVPVHGSGVVQVYCGLHSRESAEVRVVRCGRWSRVDRRGRFSLGNVPPGAWTVHFWDPRLGERSKPIEVTGHLPVTVELRNER